nr:S8 family serine peptidase [Micromonospora sp. DSM 115978]
MAAGNGRGTPDGRFRGVAPEAALMAVRSEPLYDDHTITAMTQAFELAGERPAVVSLSLGSHFGAHDGTSALELEITRQSGPGRIVVVDAGNEGEDAIHAQGQLVDGEDLVLPFRIADPRFQFVDVWIPRGDEVDVYVETPSGVRHAPTGELVETDEGAFRADFVEDPLNRDQNLLVLLAGGKANDIWKVRVSALSVVHGEVHAWAGTADAGTSRSMVPHPAEGYSVGTPAAADRCLAVGSLVSKNRFRGPDGTVEAPGLAVGGLSGFSSVGPTRNGGQKPDVVAPGQFVTAALAAGSAMATEPGYACRRNPGAACGA